MPSPLPLPRRAPASRRPRPRLALVATGLAVLATLLGLLGSLTTASATSTTASPTSTMSAAAPATDARPLVVIGVGGVQWSQVTPTGHAGDVVAAGAGRRRPPSRCAASTPRPARSTAGSRVNSGQRAADVKPPGSRNPPPCRTVPEPPATTAPPNPSDPVERQHPVDATPAAVTVPNWADYARAADALRLRAAAGAALDPADQGWHLRDRGRSGGRDRSGRPLRPHRGVPARRPEPAGHRRLGGPPLPADRGRRGRAPLADPAADRRAAGRHPGRDPARGDRRQRRRTSWPRRPPAPPCC